MTWVQPLIGPAAVFIAFIAALVAYVFLSLNGNGTEALENLLLLLGGALAGVTQQKRSDT